jgi:hypothetical protein
MVNNSTNINKMNNHLSPSLTEHKKKTMKYDIRNPGLCLGQAQKCDRVKPINGIQTLPSCTMADESSTGNILTSLWLMNQVQVTY